MLIKYNFQQENNEATVLIRAGPMAKTSRRLKNPYIPGWPAKLVAFRKNPERCPTLFEAASLGEHEALMEMLDILDNSVYASDASGELRQLASIRSRVRPVAGSFWGKSGPGVVAAAAWEERCGTSRTGNPLPPSYARAPILCGPAHTKPHHKHTVVKHRP